MAAEIAAGILSHAELRVANVLTLAPRRTFAGSVKGERQTRRKGTSIEFADYRDYAEGDDLRHLDWNVLARLDTPVMRTYLDEQDLAVYLFLDASRSMDFGEPSKFDFARRIGTLLSLAALNGGDAVYGVDPGTIAPQRAVRGRSGAGRLLSMVSLWQPVVRRGVAASVRTFAASGHRRGVVILASDGLDPELAPAISALGAAGFEVLFSHVLSRTDLDPDLEGDLTLVDAESDGRVDLTANRFALQSYKENLSAHIEGLRKATQRVGGRYLAFRSDESLETHGVRKLERDGWVKR
ncbi:MAG TPA: DUF58 domain-containing protein [Fimbriimonadaceae bacterium]|nr:DUF58 domain-containing protein [Fimbriimonadaceae bacterium]